MAGARALVVSIVTHAGLLAALAWWLDEPGRAAPRAEDRAIAIEVVAAPPLEVALIDEARARQDGAVVEQAPPAATTSGSAVDAHAGHRGRVDDDAHATHAAIDDDAHATHASIDPARGAAIDATSGAATDPATDAATAPGRADDDGPPSALAMRGLRHDLALRPEAAARILQDRPAPARVAPSGKITPAGPEGRIVDAVASYTVHGDGTVDIRNKKDIDPHLLLPIPTPGNIISGLHDLAVDIAAWKEDPYRDTRAGKPQDLPRHLQAVPGSCDSLADAMCDANPSRVRALTSMFVNGAVIIPVLGGRSDITSYLHRKYVGNPFASRQLALLDSTRDERVASGTAYRAAQLQRSAELMARNLEALWRTTGDPARRREALFELWDECTEGEGPAGEASARARAMVIGWIRARLPAGQPDAFSADEIARFDARRTSTQHFAPY